MCCFDVKPKPLLALQHTILETLESSSKFLGSEILDVLRVNFEAKEGFLSNLLLVIMG